MISFFIIATIILCTIHTYLYVKLRPLFNSHTWHIGLLVLFIIMFGLLIFQRRGFYESLPDIIPVLAYSWLGFI
ncbi:hypothetical protein LJB93_03010, partial [Desulfovibrio sp. OttesenSCG-928-F07]|nr:hypothetical protein [Desulfovibrio sp. OttesenSCG-928-F07]